MRCSSGEAGDSQAGLRVEWEGRLVTGALFP